MPFSFLIQFRSVHPAVFSVSLHPRHISHESRSARCRSQKLILFSIGFIGACLADIIMNWSLLFSDFVTENGKKHRHAIVVLVLFLDIVLNTIIGLTPYIDNFTRKFLNQQNLIVQTIASYVYTIYYDFCSQTWEAWYMDFYAD